MTLTEPDAFNALSEDHYTALQGLRWVCWTGEGAHASDLLALGDVVNRVIKSDPPRESVLLDAVAQIIQAPVSKVRHCWNIALFLDQTMRSKVTGKTIVTYTVLRSCCSNYDRSPLSDRRRWRILAGMVDAAERDGTTRIPTTAYRKAILGRPIPNSTRAITPDHMAALLTHDEFRHRLMDEINSNPEWSKELRGRRSTKKRRR